MIRVIIHRDKLRHVLNRMIDYQRGTPCKDCNIHFYMVLFFNQLTMTDSEFDSFVDDIYIERPFEVSECIVPALNVINHAVAVFNAIYNPDGSTVWRVVLDYPDFIVGYGGMDAGC